MLRGRNKKSSQSPGRPLFIDDHEKHLFLPSDAFHFAISMLPQVKRAGQKLQLYRVGEALSVVDEPDDRISNWTTIRNERESFQYLYFMCTRAVPAIYREKRDP